MPILRIVAAFSMPLVLAAVAIAVCAILERWRPAGAQPRGARDLNVLLGALLTFQQPFLSVPVAVLATLGVNMAGGGLIELPSSGWGLLIGVPVFVVAMDFGEYIFHRAQHVLPFLWAMHSLHHSDPAYNASTALRSYWCEPILKSLTVWLAVGLLFKATPSIVGAYAVVTYYNYLIHANTRINFGRFSWLLNAPAYHRVHHSALPEHFNSNYAALFPIFDVISGAYRPPLREEYPATGLGAEGYPASLLQAIIWPIRKIFAASSDLAQKV